jgi:hypothetical protein
MILGGDADAGVHPFSIRSIRSGWRATGMVLAEITLTAPVFERSGNIEIKDEIVTQPYTP